jgi:hypothetical protein
MRLEGRVQWMYELEMELELGMELNYRIQARIGLDVDN